MLKFLRITVPLLDSSNKSHFSTLLVCSYLIIMILPFTNEINEEDFFLSNMILMLEMTYNKNAIAFLAIFKVAENIVVQFKRKLDKFMRLRTIISWQWYICPAIYTLKLKKGFLFVYFF